LAATQTRAIPTDWTSVAWDRVTMTTHPKRAALDLFIEALVHPVRFR
jgi:hypothetical protein